MNSRSGSVTDATITNKKLEFLWNIFLSECGTSSPHHIFCYRHNGVCGHLKTCSAMHMGITAATLETVEVEGHGQTAIEVGRYRLLAAGDAVADQGKYIVVWKNDNGTWKLHRDIWTTSQPGT